MSTRYSNRFFHRAWGYTPTWEMNMLRRSQFQFWLSYGRGYLEWFRKKFRRIVKQVREILPICPSEFLKLLHVKYDYT